MHIRHLLLLFALTATPALRADPPTPVFTYNHYYFNFLTPVDFSWGIVDDMASGEGTWDARILTIPGFSNATWGSAYTINAGNTPEFAAFVNQLTDGETDYLVTRMFNPSGTAYTRSPEPTYLYHDASGASGIDLPGYTIDEIQFNVVADPAYSGLGAPIWGRFTINVYGTAPAAIPEPATTAGLLGLAAVGLVAIRRRRLT